MSDLKKVLSYLWLDKKNLFITITLIVVETAFELIIPFIMKDIIDEGVLKSNMEVILISGFWIIICALISLATGHLYASFNAKLVSNYSYHLRESVFKKIEEYTFENLDHFDTTSLVTRVTNDCQIMQNTIVGTVRPLFRSPVMLIMGILLSFLMAPSIAWIFAVITPIFIIIMVLIVRFTAPKYNVIQKNVDNLNLVVRENATSIRTVKAYVREYYEEKKFMDSNLNTMNTIKKTFRISLLNTPAFQLCMYTVTTLLLAFGAILVHNNSLKVGSLSAMLSYVLQVMNSIMMLSNVFLVLNKSFASAKRISEVLKVEPTIKALADIKVENGNIELKNVSFKYNMKQDELTLSNITLSIPSGSTLGIMGGTGSSKSTLAMLLLRLYDVTSGEILIDGINIKNYNLKDLRDNIVICLQNNVLFSGTVRENLLWGNENATDEEINEALRISCSDEFISRLAGGLDYDLGQGGVNVSGGQRQRLCIARALLKKPKVIIFDDSTSACDMETERKILTGLRGLKNMTAIIIGQRVNSVMNADKIIILEDGAIKNVGTHEELYKTSAIYKELCLVQLGGDSCE